MFLRFVCALAQTYAEVRARERPGFVPRKFPCLLHAADARDHADARSRSSGASEAALSEETLRALRELGGILEEIDRT